MGRGYWKQPSRGFVGLKRLGLVSHFLRGPGLQLFSVLAIVLQMEGWGEWSLSS